MSLKQGLGVQHMTYLLNRAQSTLLNSEKQQSPCSLAHTPAVLM
jgi:hypothetical protein